MHVEGRITPMTGRISEMTTMDCWALLREQEFGRLAYRLGEDVHLAPINYGLDGNRIVFRTAEGSKLSGVLSYPEVCFEVDEMNDDAAMSVVVRGRAVELHGEEALMADQLRLRPWVATAKKHIIAIDVSEITGRFFYLSKPWLHLMHH